MDNMETQIYHQEPFSHHEMVNEDQSFLEKKKSLSDHATVPDNCCGSFDCNICLDNARDPVVTLCGHLYCWPCIFKWLQTQGTSTTLELHSQPQQRCPVCKADVSDTTLVPLYGRGDFSPQTETKDSSDLEIPRRPPAYGLNALIAASPNQQLHSGSSNLQSQFESDQNQQYYAPSFSAASPMLNRGGTTIHPMIWMFGEMVHARVFGNSTEVNLVGYPNSYHHLTDSSPRVRRREMKTEKSLNRVSIFLFCCILFCLLLF